MPAALKKLHDRENGFTLVELLIVVLIIGILAAVAIPIYLGIQQQATKSAVKADVNIEVKRVQVAVTEGSALAALDNQANPKVGSARETITTAVAGDQKSYTVTGIASTSSNPAARVNFTYAYDSITGKFTESDSGSGQPAVITFSTTALPDATTTAAYSQSVSVSNSNSTGTNAFTATGLPNGLAINSTNGLISGTATTTGAFNPVITVTNGSTSASKTYTLQVNAVPTVTTANLPNPTQGAAYSQTLSATGVPNSGFTYAVTAGTLPTGLTLTGGGVLSGTPTATGPFNFSIAATNSAGTGAATAYSVVVGSTPTIAGSTSSATTIWPAFASDAAYTPSEQPVVTGYPSPTVSATGLPTGLSMSSAGVISGVPSGVGTYNITLTATNSYGTGTKNVTMNVIAGNNSYSQVVDSVSSPSTGKINFYGWAFGQGGTSDNQKANLRVDIHIDNVAYDFFPTDWNRADVNAAYGGNIGDRHGYNITMNTTSGNHSVQIFLRDSNSPSGYTMVYNNTVTVK